MGEGASLRGPVWGIIAFMGNPVIAAIEAGHFQQTSEKGNLICREDEQLFPCRAIVEARAAQRRIDGTLKPGRPKT